MSGTIDLYRLTDRDMTRMQTLMKKYSDTPMDFADASLIAVAESLNTSKILTSDSDFEVYRVNGRTRFEIIT